MSDEYRKAYRWLYYRAKRCPGILWQATLSDRILTMRQGEKLEFRSYWRKVVEIAEQKHQCNYEFQSFCAAYICWDCDDHRGLDRCYCGWARSSGDGYRELVEMGETIEPED